MEKNIENIKERIESRRLLLNYLSEEKRNTERDKGDSRPYELMWDIVNNQINELIRKQDNDTTT